MPEGDMLTRSECFGPYLRYAISTDFEYFEFFDDQRSIYGCSSWWSSRDRYRQRSSRRQ